MKISASKLSGQLATAQSPQNLSNEHVEKLKLFLHTAPQNWNQKDTIKRYVLGNGEQISCVRWKNQFYITGTDIVKIVQFRFQSVRRPIVNGKKFEEGIFSDLRNLKSGGDAALEGPRSDFLEFLWRNGCIRTKKKQKVFYWFHVPHDRLFKDALERDLKRESSVINVNAFLSRGHFGACNSNGSTMSPIMSAGSVASISHSAPSSVIGTPMMPMVPSSPTITNGSAILVPTHLSPNNQPLNMSGNVPPGGQMLMAAQGQYGIMSSPLFTPGTLHNPHMTMKPQQAMNIFSSQPNSLQSGLVLMNPARQAITDPAALAPGATIPDHNQAMNDVSSFLNEFSLDFDGASIDPSSILSVASDSLNAFSKEFDNAQSDPQANINDKVLLFDPMMVSAPKDLDSEYFSSVYNGQLDSKDDDGMFGGSNFSIPNGGKV